MSERKVTFIVGANIKNFQKNLDKAQRKFKRMGDKMIGIGQSLSAKVSLPLAGLAGISLKTAADFQTLRQSMDALNGSAEEGARNFERLKDFSARTPFQLQDLAKAQNMLQGFGMAADDAFESLNMIGDIAAISGGDIEGIGIAFGQAAAEGRLMSRDIRQLINQGVPAIKLLADTMGVAESEIFDMASEGKISFEILQQAFRDATREGGMFADGMARQSETLAGRFSTLKDNINIALGEIGQTLDETFNIKGLITELTGQIKRITRLFDELSVESKKKIMGIAALLAAGGPLMIAFGGVIKALAFMAAIFTSKFAIITGAIAGVVVTGQWFVDNWDKFETKIDNVTTSYVVAFQKMAKGIMEAIRDLIDFVINRTGPGFVADVFGWDLSGWVNDLNGLNAAIADVGADIEENTDKLVEGINKDRGIDWTGWTDAASHALELTKNTILNGLKGLLNNSEISTLISEIEGKWANLGNLGANVSGSGGEDRTPGVKSTSLEKPIISDENLLKLDTMRVSFESLNDPMSRVNEKFNEMQGEASEVAKVGAYVGQRLGEAFSQALIFSDKLGDSIKNIGKQLASRGIVNFLSLALGGGLGKAFGGGFFKGIGKLIGVKDAIISPNGNVISTAPEDYLIATKNPGYMAQSVAEGVGGGLPNMINIKVNLDGRQIYQGLQRYKDKLR